MLFIPQSTSTYGDAGKCRGGELTSYLHAQIRDDADLDWLRDLRAKFTKLDEIKFDDIENRLHELRADRALFERFLRGIGQASVVVIEPQRVADEVKDVVTRETEDEAHARELLLSTCATALLQQTPIAYLPAELSKVVGISGVEIGSLADFSPQELSSEFGGRLQHAKVVAARVHATFDLRSRPSSVSTTKDVFNSPLSRLLLSELLATQRVFDVEHQPSVKVINRAAERIAEAMGRISPEAISSWHVPLAREEDSPRVRDHMQAADIAVGWARTLLEHTDKPESLSLQFERVIVNGRYIT